MLRISMQNFVSIAVLVGSISSVAASQPLPDLQNLARIFGGLGPGPLQQVSERGIFFRLGVKYK